MVDAARRLQRCLELFQTRFFQKHTSPHVVDGRFQVQGQGGADDVHATHQLPTYLCQRAEHMLDAGTRRSDATITPLLCVRDTVRSIAFAWMCTRQPVFGFSLIMLPRWHGRVIGLAGLQHRKRSERGNLSRGCLGNGKTGQTGVG